MTEDQLDRLVRQVGAERAQHVAGVLRRLMPDLLETPAGARTRAFIEALDQAVERAQCKKKPE